MYKLCECVPKDNSATVCGNNLIFYEIKLTLFFLSLFIYLFIYFSFFLFSFFLSIFLSSFFFLFFFSWICKFKNTHITSEQLLKLP